jgi:hypothetical protein
LDLEANDKLSMTTIRRIASMLKRNDYKKKVINESTFKLQA